MAKHSVTVAGYSGDAAESASKRQRLHVIDITSDDSDIDEEEEEDDDEEDSKSEPAEIVPVTTPDIPSLAKTHPTRSALTEHLSTLPKSLLVGIIVNHVLPSTANGVQSGNATGLAQCVYCNEVFSLEAPCAGKGCRIEHSSDLEDDGCRVEYSCCGAWLEYYDYSEGHEPPENGLGDYCWEGQHRATRLKEGDFKKANFKKKNELLGLDETYDVKGLGEVELEDASWWKDWA